MAVTLGHGQKYERGSPVSPFGNPGTVNFGAFYGGTSGKTKAEISAIGPVSSRVASVPPTMPGSLGNMLTIPVALALGVLVWYAIKTYE